MTDDDGTPRPAWAVFSLADAVTALRADLSAGEPGTPSAGESMEVTAEFWVAPDEDGGPRFWVVAADQPGGGGHAAPLRVTVTLKRAPADSSGYRPSSGQAESAHGWDDQAESAHGWDDSVPYPRQDEPAPDAARGWDEGDRP